MLFNNLHLNIFIYYLLTVSTFLLVLYTILNSSNSYNIYLLAIIMLCFVILAGVFISKLAVDPLAEHIINLQNLSKETLHELNLPISTILSNTDMLKKNNTDEKSLKRIARIQKASQMLQERYNELDYMIKTQSLEELRENIQLDILIEERINFLAPIYPHIQFNTHLEITNIFNDKIGLIKVIDNLIDNAVKYSDNSNNIDITLIDDKLSIEDYGIGIDDIELINIFDNYYQTNNNIQGFGIGLNMVKRFCDINKISLQFKSKLGQGTLVTLTFKY